MNVNRPWKWIALLVFLLGLAYASMELKASQALRNAYRALEKDGRPLKAEQVIPPPVPDSDNAALLYQAAVLRLKAAPAAGSTNLFQRLDDLAKNLAGGAPAEADRAEFDRLMADPVCREALSLVRQGTGRRGCRYPLDYAKGAAMELPHLSAMRGLSRILCAQARNQAVRGDLSGGWETVLVSLRLASALQPEPTLISYLVRITQYQASLAGMADVARLGLPSEAQAAAIAPLLADNDEGRLLASALDAERILLGEWAFALAPGELRRVLFSDSTAGNSRAEKAFFTFLRLTPVWNYDHAAYLSLMQQYTHRAMALDEPGERAGNEAEIDQFPRYCVLTRMLAPALGKVRMRSVTLVAEKRITGAGLALLKYRKDHGSFPVTLGEGGNTNGMDPFTGKPLLYQARGDGFLLYSVGPNQKDDGGSPEKGVDGNPLDIAWRF
jgi:hypothetical protein